MSLQLDDDNYFFELSVFLQITSTESWKFKNGVWFIISESSGGKITYK